MIGTDFLISDAEAALVHIYSMFHVFVYNLSFLVVANRLFFLYSSKKNQDIEIFSSICTKSIDKTEKKCKILLS